MKFTGKAILLLFFIGCGLLIFTPFTLAYNYSSYHAIGMGSSGAYNLAQGMTFTVVGGNVTMLNVIKSSTTTCTQAILFSNSTGTILATNTLTSDNSTFVYDLINGTTYNIACNKTSGTYIRVYADGTGQASILSNGIRWDKGFSTDEGDSVYFFNILGIQLLSPESNITVINTFNVTQLSDNQINTSKYTPFIIKTLVLPTSPTTNMSSLNGSYTTIWYSLNTSLNNGCAVFYQKSCVANGTYVNRTMLMESNLTNQSFYNYTAQFSDNDYYPAYYPYDYTLFDKTIHTNYTNYVNNNIKFNVFNFSSTANYFLNLEFMAINSTGSTGGLDIYYCNSSYVNGNPALQSSCELVDAFAPTTSYTHGHNYSYHQGVPVRITTVGKTQNSSFIFIASGNVANGWTFGYITNSSYNNQSFTIGNYNTWGASGNTPFLFDMHLHSIGVTDNFRFYSVFNNGNGTINTSTIKYVFYNVTYQSPNAPLINLPLCNTTFTLANTSKIININWTTVTSGIGLPISYNLSVHDTFFAVLLNSTNNTFYNWSNWSSILSEGVYHFDVTAYDNYGYDTGHSCNFNVCENNWVATIQPCTNNVKVLIYEDDHYCPEKFNLPVDNGTYADCVTYIYTKNVLEPYYIPFIILIILMIIVTILAIIVYPILFLFNALISALLLALTIYYKLDEILIIVFIFCILIFTVLAIVINKMRK